MSWGGVHEVQFLNIETSLGIITFETHNEHNGYYGGFYIKAVYHETVKEEKVTKELPKTQAEVELDKMLDGWLYTGNR